MFLINNQFVVQCKKKMELNSDQWKWQDGWTERQTDNPKKNLRFLGHYKEVCDIFQTYLWYLTEGNDDLIS